MKVKYTGKTIPLTLTHGRVYEVISVEKSWYRIVDDEGMSAEEELPGYLYPPNLFEIVEE